MPSVASRAPQYRQGLVETLSGFHPWLGSLGNLVIPQSTDLPIPAMTFAPKAWLHPGGRVLQTLEHSMAAKQILGKAAERLQPEDALTRMLDTGWIRKNGLNYMAKSLSPTELKVIEKDIISSKPAAGAKIYLETKGKAMQADIDEVITSGLEKALKPIWTR